MVNDQAAPLLDTSAIGGFFDKEFASDSEDLLLRIQSSKIILVTREIVRKEIEPAPKPISDFSQDPNKDAISERFERIMKNPSVIPGFKCVDFKEQTQERIYLETRNLSPEDYIRYFKPTGPKISSSDPPNQNGVRQTSTKSN